MKTESLKVIQSNLKTAIENRQSKELKKWIGLALKEEEAFGFTKGSPDKSWPVNKMPRDAWEGPEINQEGPSFLDWLLAVAAKLMEVLNQRILGVKKALVPIAIAAAILAPVGLQAQTQSSEPKAPETIEQPAKDQKKVDADTMKWANTFTQDKPEELEGSFSGNFLVFLLPEASPQVQKEAIEKCIGHMEKSGPDTYAGQCKTIWLDYMKDQLKEVSKTLGDETISPEAAKALEAAVEQATAGKEQAAPGTFEETMLNSKATGQPTKALETASQGAQSQQFDQALEKLEEINKSMGMLKAITGMTLGLTAAAGIMGMGKK
jgi:hypothetical protein